MDKVPFRQVHLDFHTSGLIKGIGAGFNKSDFQRALKAGHVNSITVFSKCHHGYSYHPTYVNEMHPGLSFDLLGAQLEACREIGVRAPVYISAGHDEKTARKHPEWIVKGTPDSVPDFETRAGYKLLCFNSPYMDELLEEIEEVMQMYNPTEVFLDICNERICYCDYCLEGMKNEGLDSNNPTDVEKWSRMVYAQYCKKVEEAVRKYNEETVIFHNAGNIPMGRRDFASYEGHLELESLPTGGWGYDHFPMSAAYCRNLGKEYIGMTGKFHTTWGEFGGFKHPNALIYETSLSLALGAKCSIGDQLHPCGLLNESTYNLIGKAYELVEKKEKWCSNVTSIADVAILSAVSSNDGDRSKGEKSDTGANRILLEKKYLYDIIDKDCDFGKYKLIILPDCVKSNEEIIEKLNTFVSEGGKILATGNSCPEILDGIYMEGESEFCPDYMYPVHGEAFTNGKTEYVMYSKSYKFNFSRKFKVVAYSVYPYFNRTPEHFSSHQHAPDNPGTMHPLAVISPDVAYVNHNVFEDYATKGELHCKELVDFLINELIGKEKTLSVKNVPDRGIVTVQNQSGENRWINHILFAHTSVRGNGIEVIEDAVPIFNVEIKICSENAPKSVKLVPEDKNLDYKYENGIITYAVPEVLIHQMVETQF